MKGRAYLNKPVIDGNFVFLVICKYFLRVIFSSSYTNADADLKISLYVRVHINITPGKCRILNSQNCKVIFP